VQHAHEKGIIHRDLKPGNVLLASAHDAPGGSAETVTTDKSHPSNPSHPSHSILPRITDFGLARTRESGLSVTGEALGTPSYMPPEQARGQLKEMGPASDVYGLGAVLYCLLTGRPPFQSSEPVQTMKQVCESEPVSPRRLNALVPRDLETICLKCLQKEPARRYQSAMEVADDLGRYERGEPVQARPVGRPERAWRWCRRNPAIAGMLAALTVVIVASLAGLTALYLHADQQRQVAEEQRQAAEQRETEVRAVTRFYEDHVLAAARPAGWAGGAGKDVSLKQALDRSALTIDVAFAGQPVLEAAVHNTLGMTYWYLGEFKDARPHLEHALKMRREQLGDDHRDTLTSQHNLGMLRWKQGKDDEAIKLFREVLKRRRHILGAEHRDTLWTQLNLGMMLMDRPEPSDVDEAETLLQQGVEFCQRSLGREDFQTLWGQHDLALTLRKKGKTEKALDLMRKTFEGRRRALGADHPDTLRTMGALAGSLMLLGKLDEAEPLFRKRLDASRRVLGPEHVETLIAEWYLSELLLRKSKPSEAEPIIRHALLGYRRLVGPHHPDTLDCVIALGEVLCNLDRSTEAESELRNCLTADGNSLPLNIPAAAYARSLLGHSLARQGKFAEAEPLLLAGYESLSQRKYLSPWGLVWRHKAFDRIIDLYDNWGKPDQARAWRMKRPVSGK
jgi:tetratricopeptide (TPR) repeat protein